jgi:hypothetical protein
MATSTPAHGHTPVVPATTVVNRVPTNFAAHERRVDDSTRIF